jgi:hypothetical protein
VAGTRGSVGVFRVFGWGSAGVAGEDSGGAPTPTVTRPPTAK